MENNGENTLQAKLMQVVASRPSSKVAKAIEKYYAHPGMLRIARLIEEIAKDAATASDVYISLGDLMDEFMKFYEDANPFTRMAVAADVVENCSKIHGKRVDDNHERAEQLAENLRHS